MTHPLDAVVPDRGGRRSLCDLALDKISRDTPDDLLPLLRALRDLDRVSDRVLCEWFVSNNIQITTTTIHLYRRGVKPRDWCAAHDIDLDAV